MGRIHTFPARGFRAQLRQAMAQEDVVQVSRGQHEMRILVGRVMGVGKDFFLLWLIDESLRFGGLMAVRHEDVTEVMNSSMEAELCKRALALQGLTPTVPEGLALDTVEDVVTTLGAFDPTLSLEVDERETDEEFGMSIFIGQWVNPAPQGFEMLEINPEGAWEPEPSYFSWEEIRSVLILDHYAMIHHQLAVTSDGECGQSLRRAREGIPQLR